MDNWKTVAGKMREARMRAGLTQEQVAERMGIRQPQISFSENGRSTSIRFVEKYIAACGFRLELTARICEK